MATDLSSITHVPHVTSETVGTSWVEFTLPVGALRADVYFDTNAGVHSYESDTPSVEAPIPADTWFLVWETPGSKSSSLTRDYTFQLKAASAGTTVYVRVN
jgi:hypothetical protein